MKIILFSRRQLSHTAAEICQLFNALRLFGFDYAVNEEFAPLVTELTGMQIPPEKVYGQCIGQQPADSLMVCYGGDGTLLEGVHRLCGHGHQCRAPRVPDQRPERRAEPDLRRGRGRTPHHRAPLDDRSHGRLCRAARHGAGAQRIHRTASRCRHDLGRNLRRRADGGHLPRRRRDRLDPRGRRPTRSAPEAPS